MKALTRISVLGILAGTIVFSLLIFTTRPVGDGRNRDHAVGLTRAYLMQIQNEIEMYAIEFRRLPWAPHDYPTNVSAHEVYLQLVGDSNTRRLALGHKGWMTAETFLDFWTNEFLFNVKNTSSNVFNVRVWSDGPNRINDSGGEDDIAITFDINFRRKAEVKAR